MSSPPLGPIDVVALAKAMCVAAGQNPSHPHNGYDPTWRLYWSEAARIANVYNELFVPDYVKPLL